MQKKYEELHESVEAASTVLKAISHRMRLLILCKLIEGECNVGQLADYVKTRSSTISQHLTAMRYEGIVQSRKDGQTVWYSICSQEVIMILQTLHKAYCKNHETDDSTFATTNTPNSLPQ